MERYDKIYFGGEQPATIDYKVRPDGTAEVWVYKDVRNVGTEEEPEWVAKGVFFTTALPESEIAANTDQYFVEEEPEPTISDLVEAIDILTNIILEGE